MNLTSEYKNQVHQAHPEFEDYLNVLELTVLLNLSKSGVHNLLKSGRLPAFRIQKRILIDKAEVLKYLEECKQNSPYKKSQP